PSLRHRVRARKHRGNVAEHRQEAGDEDKPAPVTHEQPFGDFDSLVSQPKPRSVFRYKRVTEGPADPKADNLAGDARKGSDGDQEPNVEAMGPGAEKSGRNQRCLGRQRDADAFERNERGDDPDAIGRDKLYQVPLPDRRPCRYPMLSL